MSTKTKRKKQATQPAPEYDPAMVDRLQLAALAEAQARASKVAPDAPILAPERTEAAAQGNDPASPPAASPGPKSTDAAAQAMQRQAAALQGLTAALDRESWQRLARLYPMLAEGIQQAIIGGASAGAIGAIVNIRAGSEGLASMALQAATHFAATYSGPVVAAPDPMGGVIAALDAMAWDDLIDRYPDLGQALQVAVAQGLPIYAIRAHVAAYSRNSELAHYVDQAASHVARIMAEY